MKIIYVITKSNLGGAQRYVLELAEAAQAAGHEVYVASAPGGALVTACAELSVTHLPVTSFQRDISFFKEVKALHELRRMFTKLRPDIVHINSSKAGVLASLAARLCRVPRILFTAHGWPFLERRPFWWKTMAWLGSYLTALLVHQVILVSQNDFIHTAMPRIKRKSRIIPTAVPDIRTTQAAAPHPALLTTDTAQYLRIVTVAELHPNKNLADAIRSVARHNATADKHIHYTIIGEGEERTALQNLINELSLSESVHLAGYIKNARNYLSHFDAFLLPSLKEGMPYAVLEAGAIGLPVVCSRVGGIPEIVDHRKSGLLFDPTDTEGLLNALLELSGHNNRAELGTQLQSKIQNDFTLQHMREQTLALYLGK